MSDIDRPQLGLVLSGGGAKGAYQVGVLQALQELGVGVDMVAGTSIGALNGAVLACAPSYAEGVERLRELWLSLADESPLQANVPAYVALLAAAGLAMNRPMAAALTQIVALQGKNDGALPGLQALDELRDPALLSDKPLQRLFDEYVDLERLAHGPPLYVAVYESRGAFLDALRCLAAQAGVADTPPSRFVHVQSLPANERRNVLLASAAIPLLYKARRIEERRYSDGGQGGWRKSHGNTPITPLLDAGCRQLIVTHLSDGSLWNRNDFDATVIEIRPESRIVAEDGVMAGARATLGFNRSNITRLINLGHEDTLRCVGRVVRTARGRQALQRMEESRSEAVRVEEAADARLAEALSRLR